MSVYENYRKLLLAIKNTDLKGNKSNPVVVYDTFDSDILIGVFDNLNTVSELFKMKKDSIHRSIRRTGLLKNRFRIEKIRGEI